jgi:hypothetical protein
MSAMGQSRHFSRRPAASGLPRSTDIVRPPRNVGLVCHEQKSSVWYGASADAEQGQQRRVDYCLASIGGGFQVPSRIEGGQEWERRGVKF